METIFEWSEQIRIEQLELSVGGLLFITRRNISQLPQLVELTLLTLFMH